eukprot:5774651-Pleurochrysis_carterae.AAC.1
MDRSKTGVCFQYGDPFPPVVCRVLQRNEAGRLAPRERPISQPFPTSKPVDRNHQNICPLLHTSSGISQHPSKQSHYLTLIVLGAQAAASRSRFCSLIAAARGARIATNYIICEQGDIHRSKIWQRCAAASDCRALSALACCGLHGGL